MVMRTNAPALLCRRVNLSTPSHHSHNLIARRPFISLWKKLRQDPDSPEDLVQLLDYRRYGAFPDLNRQKIRLWDGDKEIGITNMARVMKDHLRPGKMLCWCGNRKQQLYTPRPQIQHSQSAALFGHDTGCDHLVASDVATMADHPYAAHGEEKREHLAAAPTGHPPRVDMINDYEIFSIDADPSVLSIASPSPTITAEEYRTSKVHLHTVMRPRELQHALSRAYHLLCPESLASRYPVEFHLRPPADSSKTAKFSIQQHASINRFDLHPKVILRAMPPDSLQVLGPLISHKGTDLVWLAVSQNYSLGSWRGSRLVKELDHILIGRWERLKQLLDMGRLSSNEALLGQQPTKPARKLNDMGTDDWKTRVIEKVARNTEANIRQHWMRQPERRKQLRASNDPQRKRDSLKLEMEKVIKESVSRAKTSTERYLNSRVKERATADNSIRDMRHQLTHEGVTRRTFTRAPDSSRRPTHENREPRITR